MLELLAYKHTHPGIAGNFDRLIRFATHGIYSHVELRIDGVCWSSSARDGGVRRKIIDTSSGHWDIFKLNKFNKETALSVFEECEGDPYDYPGAIGVVIPMIKEVRRWKFCNEICGMALGLPESHKYSPTSFVAKVISIEHAVI